MDSPVSSAAATPAPAASTADPPSSAPSSPSLARSSSSSPDPTNPSPSPISSPPPASASAGPDAPAAPPSASSAHRRVPPPCWSTEETIALIDAYQDKWYSLRRGNLRASDWQDVADAVAARGPRRLASSAAATSANNPLPSSASSSSAPKTAVQCRHKVEKLRKRYRAERQRSLKRNPRAPPKSSWEFFRKMHAMETGGPPLPAKKGGAAAGMAGSGTQARRGTGPGAASPLPSSSDDDDNNDEEDSHNYHQRFRHTRPLNGLMMMTTPNGPGSSATRHGHGGPPPAAGPPTSAGFRFKVPKAVRTKLLSPRGEAAAAMAARHHGNGRPFVVLPRHHQMPSSTHRFTEMTNRLLDKKRKHHVMQMEEEEEDHQAAPTHYGGGAMGEVAEAVTMLGDGFMRMERMKMDMAMQIHRLRMETEMKRTQMLLDSNRKIVDMMLGGGVTGASNKRAKANT